ncbi:MAG TPA: NAD(P)-dependent oxidoreductase [Candidatus Pacebacteria bacterium]|nr:MAG: D-beta-hydroxybutyrate dehydrogenase [Microgenomates group bacterium GW2011_GWB1_45_17]KKU24144.1 MAG: D-beta-hydroxybutyrate dehydrogenase [Microgenomates group bacterium GW2011_GWC1_46_15]KKU24859.1 MAG: D-beta-hydroxybutyrate dehydrogenase [Microgenomates group bacterium GW2011_GWA1_46_15]HAV14766.1 NAD(P)-dependent oxidoreductase [Candidatus Paceibacterota bacterium]HCR11472.1 NAD(P)-dependent oxidoreductase [Candidatus Paceibacterota bacterium]
MTLKHKVAVVTGGSDGIGRQIVLKLATQGVHVAILGRNTERLTAVEKEANEAGSPKAKLYVCDLRSLSMIKEVVGRILHEFGGVDVLINNAGIWQKKMPLEELEEGVVDEVIQTNLTAQIHLTRLLLPALKKQKEAAIINVISKSGVTAQEGQTIYSASKWGMAGFTEVLKTDLHGSHVRVASVYQSGTRTDMFMKTGEKFSAEKLEKFTDPADLADVIVFMLSRPPKIWLHDVRVEQ